MDIRWTLWTLVFSFFFSSADLFRSILISCSFHSFFPSRTLLWIIILPNCWPPCFSMNSVATLINRDMTPVTPGSNTRLDVVSEAFLLSSSRHLRGRFRIVFLMLRFTRCCLRRFLIYCTLSLPQFFARLSFGCIVYDRILFCPRSSFWRFWTPSRFASPLTCLRSRSNLIPAWQ